MGCDIHAYIVTNDNKIISIDLARSYELFGVLFNVRQEHSDNICSDLNNIKSELLQIKTDNNAFKRDILDENNIDNHSHCYCTLIDIGNWLVRWLARGPHSDRKLSKDVVKRIEDLSDKMIENNAKYFICSFDN